MFLGVVTAGRKTQRRATERACGLRGNRDFDEGIILAECVKSGRLQTLQTARVIGNRRCRDAVDRMDHFGTTAVTKPRAAKGSLKQSAGRKRNAWNAKGCAERTPRSELTKAAMHAKSWRGDESHAGDSLRCKVGSRRRDDTAHGMANQNYVRESEGVEERDQKLSACFHRRAGPCR